MNKKILSLGISGLVMFSALSGAISAYANEASSEITPRRAIVSYPTTTIPVVSDKEFGPAKKANKSKAVNNTTTATGDLICWMESDLLNVNLTDKVSYSSPGRYLITYKDGQSQINKDVKLNISTATHYLKEGKSGGSWSPDEY